MQVITSKDNEIIKSIRKLKEKKQRELTNTYLIEGIKIIEEAITEKANIKKIIICEECLKDTTIEPKFLYEIAKYDCVYVSDKVFASLTEVVTPQGMLAVIERNKEKDNINFKEDMMVVLDGIQDPGNLGTILRTIDSVGLTQVIVSKSTVDVYNSKVVRSTMGAIFRVNVIPYEDLTQTLKTIQEKGYDIVATSLDAEETIYNLDFYKKVIIIGNEANGVSKELMEIANQKVKIQMLGKTESLNASVATGIILYEYVRRKITKQK